MDAGSSTLNEELSVCTGELDDEVGDVAPDDDEDAVENDGIAIEDDEDDRCADDEAAADDD